MAKETTDQYKIKVTFPDAKTKFVHTLRNFRKELDLTQTKSDVLTDNYTVQIGFKTIKDKFNDLFHKGEWVTSYTVKSAKSSPLHDEFEVEVKSKGGPKPFEKSFHSQGGTSYATLFDVDHVLVSTNTKNLGILNPQGEVVTKNQKDVLSIMRIFLIDSLRTSGFKKTSRIPDKSDKNQFSVSVINGDYFDDWKSRLICIHLAGWKIGFTPIKGNLDRFKIQVAYPTLSSWRSRHNKKPDYHPWYTDDFTVENRVRIKQDHTPLRYGRTEYDWRELFLGDPTLSDTLEKFFKCIAQTPLPK